MFAVRHAMLPSSARLLMTHDGAGRTLPRPPPPPFLPPTGGVRLAPRVCAATACITDALQQFYIIRTSFLQQTYMIIEDSLQTVYRHHVEILPTSG